jgi:hypothetical protein
MKLKTIAIISASIMALLIVIFVLSKDKTEENKTLYFSFPMEGALFPKDFTAPTFYWEDKKGANSWEITVNVLGKKELIKKTSSDNQWKPSKEEWDLMKKKRMFRIIELLVKENKTTTRNSEIGK